MRALRSPQKYIQGPGCIGILGDCLSGLAESVLIVIDPFLYGRMLPALDRIITKTGIRPFIMEFGGNADNAEVDRLVSALAEHCCDAIAGVGGGKTADTVKAAGDIAGCYVVVVPTVAATDAPCSSLAIIAGDRSDKREIRTCRKNPDLILVDTSIIAKAPVRMFAAGIGDALATYPEARAVVESGCCSFIGEGYYPTRLVLQIGRCCHDILLDSAVEAYNQINAGKCGEAFEDVIEAGILLSGLGFENSGCAGAHSISKGLSAIGECSDLLHGEKVAFGVLCQLAAEKRFDELKALQPLYMRIGLPVTLRSLGITDGIKDKIHIIAERSMTDTFWHNEPFEVTVKDVEEYISYTHEIGVAMTNEPR